MTEPERKRIYDKKTGVYLGAVWYGPHPYEPNGFTWIAENWEGVKSFGRYRKALVDWLRSLTP